MKSFKEYINEFLVTGHTTNNIDNEFVDLNLESGTLWCTHNLGAEKPYEVGNFYMFGQTEVPKHNTCTWKTSPLNGGNDVFDPDYFKDMKYTYLNEHMCIKPEYDAAYQESNGDWRIPTRKQVSELLLNTNSEFGMYNGCKVIKLSSKLYPDNFIYIPLSGYKLGDIISNIGTYAGLWASDLYKSDQKKAWAMTFTAQDSSLGIFQLCNGLQIRPVKNTSFQ